MAEAFFSKSLETGNGKGGTEVEDTDVRAKRKLGWRITGCIGISVEELHQTGNSGRWVVLEIEYTSRALIELVSCHRVKVMKRAQRKSAIMTATKQLLTACEC